MTPSSTADKSTIVRQHFQRFFNGHASEDHVWTLGRAIEELPRLRIVEFAPGPQSVLWVYATVGTWEACKDPMLEFILIAPAQDLRHVELLTMSAWYHIRHRLREGHTFPMGEPWLPGSTSDGFLVSKPYPFGPELEICKFPKSHLHVLWLLPITPAEREFKIREGQEALEQVFDDCGLEYWNPTRDSVV